MAKAVLDPQAPLAFRLVTPPLLAGGKAHSKRSPKESQRPSKMARVVQQEILPAPHKGGCAGSFYIFNGLQKARSSREVLVEETASFVHFSFYQSVFFGAPGMFLHREIPSERPKL